MGGGCWRYRGPIGRDDAREGLVWAWYRSWPYRRKFGSRKCVKTRGKNRILHESGREKSPEAGNQKIPSKSTIPDSILMVPEVKSRLNEPKPVKSGQKSDFIFFHIFRGVGYKIDAPIYIYIYIYIYNHILIGTSEQTYKMRAFGKRKLARGRPQLS